MIEVVPAVMIKNSSDSIKSIKDAEMKKRSEPTTYIEELVKYVTLPYPQFEVVRVLNFRTSNMQDETIIREVNHNDAVRLGYGVPIDRASESVMRVYLEANIDIETGGSTLILLERRDEKPD